MRKFLSSESGSIAPIFALSLAAIIGVIATTIALASDSKAANEIQRTADSAAIAGATAFATLETPKAEERLQQALQAAEDYAVANSDYTLVEIDLDAVTEDAYGQTTSIDVELEFQPANVMARVAGRSGNVAVRRRASAEAVWGFPLCVLTLADDGQGLIVEGNARMSALNCIVWSNSLTNNSMEFRGGKTEARGFCAAGNVIGSSRTFPPAESGCNAIPNPLESWVPPGPGSCQEPPEGFRTTSADNLLKAISGFANSIIDYRTSELGGMQAAIDEANAFLLQGIGGTALIDTDGQFMSGPAKGLTLEELLQIAGQIDNVDPSTYAGDSYAATPTASINPGTYCGLDVAYGHLKMNPGVYHIKDAPLTVRRRGTLTGEGVTIILSGNQARFSVLDEGRLTLTAPTTGDTAGFALVEDIMRYDKAPDAKTSGTKPSLFSGLSRTNNVTQTSLMSRLTGSGTINAIGTIYLPHHEFKISGSGAGDQASPLLQIVANRVIMKEEGKLNIEFDPTQTEVPVGIKPARTARLVH